MRKIAGTAYRKKFSGKIEYEFEAEDGPKICSKAILQECNVIN
jgi:hypothetical protein